MLRCALRLARFSRQVIPSEGFKREEYVVPYVEHANAPPQNIYERRAQLLNNGWRDADPTRRKSIETHKSNAEVYISKVPAIQSKMEVARCIGGTQIGAGHPQVYIQLNTKNPKQPVSCKYCGLRYIFKH